MTSLVGAVPLEQTVLLRDGAEIVIRSMDPTDAGLLLRFHRALSPETTRLRYFTVHPELRPEELFRFTHVDHDVREALVATCNRQIVAVGRYDRTPDTASAEVAFVVADDWQGRGLGTLLFRGLATRAVAHGITTFLAVTLGENRKMLQVLQDLGLPLHTSYVDGMVHAVVDITSEEVPS